MQVVAEPAEEGRAVRVPLQVAEKLVRVAQGSLEKAHLAGLLPGLDFVGYPKGASAAPQPGDPSRAAEMWETKRK